MKFVENKIMLITYSDSLGHNMSELRRILQTYIGQAIGGIHLLPFFPSSGDRGFAPLTYQKVDPQLGSWEDIRQLAEQYYLMSDYMVNHISAQSQYYQDFLAHKDQSPYKNLFIRYKDFWPGGEPTPDQVDRIYKRKPRAPYVEARFADGTAEKVWCTFGEEQIDLNLKTAEGLDFLRDNLISLARHGLALIRLDAFAYATKRAGSSCFFVEPDIWQLLDFISATLKPFKVAILPEIHEHYSMQLKIARQGYYVYDFALPMLLLNALYFGQSAYLKHWLAICPRRQFTTLDTHDGIGVVDVKDLLPEAEIERTKEGIYRYGANVKRIYSSASYHNLDVYQVNCTYYSALGEDDRAYLIARAVQFFAPGIPQVYYVGMLAGRNDIELLEKTKEGRNINRHYYTEAEVAAEVRRPVVSRLLDLMRFRNNCPAFDGSFEILPSDGQALIILRQKDDVWARLAVDFHNRSFTVTAGSATEPGEVILSS
ncbi:sucrose phosphorylase [Oscillospiraceae bacterium HV4-5-C5C]|nr:sucrose phosphorylase [Oscillospiraceae bacterium HV4-5-C5C]